MSRNDKPDPFGELVLSEATIDALEGLNKHERIEALRAIADVFVKSQTGSGHSTSNGRDGVDLSGWDTMPFGHEGKRRFIYRTVRDRDNPDAACTVEVLYVGKKSDKSLYSKAGRVADTFGPDSVMSVWETLDIVDTAAHDVGIPDWDLIPEKMHRWERDQMVADGVLTEDEADVVSSMEAWNAKGEKDAREAGMSADTRPLSHVAVSSLGPLPPGLSPAEVMKSRMAGRCGKWMPQARSNCARPSLHNGPCRQF